MHIAITQSELVSMLLKDEYANWTYESARALASHIDNLEWDDSEQSIDIVAIRCEYSQYLDNKKQTALEQVLDDYSLDGVESFEDLSEHTTVIYFGSGIIITEF